MAVATLPRILQLPDGPSPRVTGAMGLSLVFHCVMLAMLAGLRLTPVERPEGSIQVSLVSLSGSRTGVAPKPATAPVERQQTPPPPQAAPPPKPVPAPALVRPEPMPKVAPSPVPVMPAPTATPALKTTAPRVAPVTAAPPLRQSPTTKKEPDRLVSDVLKQIELPPEVPQLGELPPPAPATPLRQVESYKTDPAAQKLSTRIRDLRVPDTPPSSSPEKATAGPSQTQPARPVISEDILEKLRRPVEQIQRLPAQRQADPREGRVASAKPATPSLPDQAASADLTPATSIQAAGAGTSRYWALVEQKINNRWVAPPVDLTQRFFQVVIRFTLDRSGRVIDVMVERSSGNDYYDNAGRRAVLAADPLPPFPPEIKERQLSPLIYFSVGEPAG